MNNSWWVDEDQLDDEQKQIISLDPSDSCLILGPPGSGKTNLLALRAKYLQALGRHNFAFIAFTKGLKAFLDFGLNKYNIGDNAIFTFFSWAHRICKLHGVTLSYNGAFDENRQCVNRTLRKIIEEDGYSPDFDTILLDEAQDYTVEEIEIFKAASKHIMLVADSRQRIFRGSETDIKKFEILVGNIVSLERHYRNGYNICKLADAIDDTGSKIFDSSNYKEDDNPSRVEHRKYSSIDDSITHLIENVSNQLVAYHGENIGIICPTRAMLNSLRSILPSTIGKNCAFHFDDDVIDFSQGKPVYCLTLHSAKGMEFRAVHMFGWDEFQMPLPRNIIYTAVTRAKTSLSIYYVKNPHRLLMQALASLSPVTTTPKMSDLFK